MNLYGQKLEALVKGVRAEVRSEVPERVKAGDDASDVIFELVDSWVPVYNSDILETVSESPELWQREPELGPAFDGSATPVNIGASIIFDVLTEEAWDEYNDLETEEDEEDERGASDGTVPRIHSGRSR